MYSLHATAAPVDGVFEIVRVIATKQPYRAKQSGFYAAMESGEENGWRACLRWPTYSEAQTCSDVAAAGLLQDWRYRSPILGYVCAGISQNI